MRNELPEIAQTSAAATTAIKRARFSGGFLPYSVD